MRGPQRGASRTRAALARCKKVVLVGVQARDLLAFSVTFVLSGIFPYQSGHPLVRPQVAAVNSQSLYRIATTSRYFYFPVREHAVPVCFRAASKEAAHS
jgi:hypothetical protein